MSQTISSAVGELIKRQQGTVSYTDTGKEVVVTFKPAHYLLHIQLIDKEASKKKQASVKLDKTYTYPKEIEEAVLWDALLNLRQAIIAHTGEQGIESWDNTFGKRWPELLIRPASKWDDKSYVNAYTSGYHQAKRKYSKPPEEAPTPPTPKPKKVSRTESNYSERGFTFGSYRAKGYAKYAAFYRFDNTKNRVHVGYFKTSQEAKEAAYKAATQVNDLASTNDKANTDVTNPPKPAPQGNNVKGGKDE